LETIMETIMETIVPLLLWAALGLAKMLFWLAIIVGIYWFFGKD
jgi:hypothetical protein